MPLNTRTALQYRVPRALEHIPLLVKVTRLGTSFLRVRVCWSGVRGLQTTNLPYKEIRIEVSNYFRNDKL